jgi:N-acetylmuramoyl-L-alanine amidase
MKKMIPIVLCLFVISPSLAQINIDVVYPRAGQQIALVDSEFIFGNVTPGCNLSINGQEIKVHRDGGWLAFLPVDSGRFTFGIKARKGDDSSFLEVPVLIGADIAARYIPRNISPGSKAIYSVGDDFEFSFEAPGGGKAWFSIDDRPLVKMLEASGQEGSDPGSVFGRSPSPAAKIMRYFGFYRFEESDTGGHRICYQYTNPAQSAVENPVVFRNCIDSLITVQPSSLEQIGILSGVSQIIRVAPGMGYKMLGQPPGVLVRIAGMFDGFYRLRLAADVTGYTNVDSVRLLPSGTLFPRATIGFITVDADGRGIKISMDVGAKLPYEISEEIGPARINVDIFGAVSNVDWIRYNTDNHMIKIVKWSQPQDGVFRMTLEGNGYAFWGYEAHYLGNSFVLMVKEQPKLEPTFFKKLRGLKIAIDPGHSHDTGAIGPTGLCESDANLWIAHELRKMLESEGAEVIMTRYGHEDVALYDRPRRADKWGADLLISVHNNALPDGINPFFNNGASVYYYHPHSKRLAEAIHRHMLTATRLRDHGLYYGNLALTRYSAVPAVLVECAFMMIPEQEAALKTDKFQRKCARAIRDGIIDFVRSSK